MKTMCLDQNRFNHQSSLSTCPSQGEDSGSVVSPFTIWNGEMSPGTWLAVTLNKNPQWEISGFLIEAGYKDPVYVPIDRFNDFLIMHCTKDILFENIQYILRRLHDVLSGPQLQDIIVSLMGLARVNRLHDFSLMKLLLGLAELGDHVITQSNKSKNNYADNLFFTDPRQLLYGYVEIYSKANELSKQYAHNSFFPSAIGQFGMLTESVQVKAAIALTDLEYKELTIDTSKMEKLAQKYQKDMDMHSDAMLSLPEASIFKRSIDKSVRYDYTDTGFPKYSEPKLQAVLCRIAEEGVLNGLPPVPSTKRSGLSKKEKHWVAYEEFSPFIKHWLGMRRAHKGLPGDMVSQKTVSAKYNVLVATGRTSSKAVNIQGMPRAKELRECFVPSMGKIFLIIDFCFIELVALAAVCQRLFNYSILGDTIRNGYDPHAITAAAMNGMHLQDFMRLKDGNPQAFTEMRQRAKAINFGVPGGMGAETLCQYARDSFGVNMSVEQAEAWRQRLISEIYPEIGCYLNWGSSMGIVPTGRLRNGVSYTEAHNTPFQGLAADGAKLALFELFAHGYRVVAFIHDEFVIEIPSYCVNSDTIEADNSIVKNAEGIVCSSMSSVLGCNLPVKVESRLATNWSKK